MSKQERLLIGEIRDSADAYLKAKNHSDRYLGAIRFGDAMFAFTKVARLDPLEADNAKLRKALQDVQMLDYGLRGRPRVIKIVDAALCVSTPRIARALEPDIGFSGAAYIAIAAGGLKHECG